MHILKVLDVYYQNAQQKGCINNISTRNIQKLCPLPHHCQHLLFLEIVKTINFLKNRYLHHENIYL